MKQSKEKAYLKGKKLLSGVHLDFTMQSFFNHDLAKQYDSILVEGLPGFVPKVFFEDLIDTCRSVLSDKGLLFLALPRRGVVIQHEIMREDENTTLYRISK